MAKKTEIQYLPPMGFFDLYHEVKNRHKGEPLPGAGNSSQKEDSDFAGASWAEAMGMMENGWKDGASKVERMLEKVDASESPADGWSLEAGGSFPCVPAYLSGEPECMWQRVVTEQIKPRIAFVVPSVYPWTITAEQLVIYGTACAAIVRAVEAAGNDIAIYSVDATGPTYGTGKTTCQGFIVRDFGVPLDTSIVAYAFHPAMLRRTLFAHRELTPTWVENGAANDGYGRADTKLTPEIIKACVGDVSAAAAIIPSPYDISNELTEENLPNLIAKFRGIVETAKREAIGS